MLKQSSGRQDYLPGRRSCRTNLIVGRASSKDTDRANTKLLSRSDQISHDNKQTARTPCHHREDIVAAVGAMAATTALVAVTMDRQPGGNRVGSAALSTTGVAVAAVWPAWRHRQQRQSWRQRQRSPARCRLQQRCRLRHWQQYRRGCDGSGTRSSGCRAETVFAAAAVVQR